MKKINNSKFYIILIGIIACVVVAFFIRLSLNDQDTQALVYPLEVYEGDPVTYVDSTRNAKKWLWEFGNGESSEDRAGEYRYEGVGSYKIRLTVDDSRQMDFLVAVKPRPIVIHDSLIKINAPDTAMQNEQIIFRGIGPSKQWRWSFGRTGVIDSREQIAVYSYSSPGTYIVELMTEETKYPILHQIVINPTYVPQPDIIESGGNENAEKEADIARRLQAIIDGKPFNTNYNHILNQYLCNNPQVLVEINGEKKNDFYSYCQGLRIIARRNNTVIEDVTIVIDRSSPRCVQKLHVRQASNED